MNVTRICELAAVMVACLHENTATIAVDVGKRWCMRCGALRSGADGRWLPPILVEDLGRHLIDEPPAKTEVDPRQMPLPLGMRRRRP